MIFFMRWKPPARPRRGPAGSRSICWRKRRTARSSGAVPCYLKSHSRGEYVFDRGWAEAYERAGGSTTPSSRSRCRSRRRPAAGCCVRPSPGADRSATALIAGLIELCRRHEASSVHFTFLPEAEWHAAGRARIPASHRPAVPLGERRLRQFDAFLEALVGPQAQDHQARAARRARARHHRRSGSPAGI